MLSQFYRNEEHDGEDKHLAKDRGRGRASVRHTDCSAILSPMRAPHHLLLRPRLPGGLPPPPDCEDGGNSGHAQWDQPSIVSALLSSRPAPRDALEGPTHPMLCPLPAPRVGLGTRWTFNSSLNHWISELLKYLHYVCIQWTASVVNEKGIKEISETIPSKRDFLKKQNLGSI